MSATTAPPSIFDGIRSIFKDKAKRRPPKDPKWKEQIDDAKTNIFHSGICFVANLSSWGFGSSPNVAAANVVISAFNLVASINHFNKANEASAFYELQDLNPSAIPPKNLLTLNRSTFCTMRGLAINSAVLSSTSMMIGADYKQSGLPGRAIVCNAFGGVMAFASVVAGGLAYHFWRKDNPHSGGSGPKP